MLLRPKPVRLIFLPVVLALAIAAHAEIGALPEDVRHAATWLIAQADAMPVWKPSDEFEAARKRRWLR
jgi:hypothetical protein